MEAGCDEAGRGCLAGPVVAAAVVLRHGLRFKGLNDSKKLNRNQRNRLRHLILNQVASYGIGVVEAEEIDSINILNASFLAMHRAIDQLTEKPKHLLIDGNRFKPYASIPHTCIIKGDGKYASIAAASILAKTHRDELMEKLALQYPHYGWERNAGYPTKIHREAIRTHGLSPYHRKSFRQLPDQLHLLKNIVNNEKN